MEMTCWKEMMVGVTCALANNNSKWYMHLVGDNMMNGVVILARGVRSKPLK